MKILITGINGQVGHALMHHLKEHELVGLTRQDCDLYQPNQIEQTIDQHQPDLIINPAAFTQVDLAESESALAFQINRDAPMMMAKKAREYKIPFIHFSTDYVYDGKKEEAYKEENETNPLGIYGQSKLAGEEAVQEVGGKNYIFRTSWVYSDRGQNFYLTMRQLSYERAEIKVVADQIGVPTSSTFIAMQIEKIIPQLYEDNTGLYHLVPNGSCSWYEFAKQIISETNPNFNVDNLHAIKTSELETKTKRPPNSYLDNQKIKEAFMLKFNSWQVELNKVIK